MNPPSQRPAFEVRLLVLYILCVSSFPTFVVYSDFGSIESSIEDWNWVLGWSFILIGPLLGALYLALRNFRRMPFLALLTCASVGFHIYTTVYDYGFYPRFVPDMDPGTPISLCVPCYLRGGAIIALPFVALYLLWKFWPNLKSRFARIRTDPSTSSG
jgi:hypothetical protein